MQVLVVNNQGSDLIPTLEGMNLRVHTLAPDSARQVRAFLARQPVAAAFISPNGHGPRPRTLLKLVNTSLPDCAVILLPLPNGDVRFDVTGFDAVAPQNAQPKELASILKHASCNASTRKPNNQTRAVKSTKHTRKSTLAPYQSLVESAGDAIFVLDHRGSILFANTAANRLFGYRNLVTQRKTIYDLLEITESPYNKAFRDYLATGKTGIHWDLVRMWGLNAQAQRVPLELTFNHFVQNDARYFTLFVRDVSERQRVEDALRASQKYAENIIESSIDMIIAVDVNRKIIEFNRAAEETFGYKRSEVFGQDARILYAELDEGQTVHRDMVRYGKTVRQVLNRRKNGTTFSSLLSASTLLNVHGQPIGYMGVSRDITVEHELENQLRERIELLEALGELDRALALPRPLRELLPIVTQHATRRLGGSLNALWLYDAPRSQLQLAVRQDIWQDGNETLALGMGLAGRVAADSRMEWTDEPGAEEQISIGAPLLYHGELLGVLVIARETPREPESAIRPFRDADGQVMNLFASRAASAIQTARLWEETSQRAEQLALLYDAGLTLNNVLEPRTQMEFLSKIAMRALNAEQAAFFRHDDEAHTLGFEFGLGGETEFAERMSHANCTVGDERSIPGWVSRHRSPFNMPEAQQEPRWVSGNTEVGSGLWVPVEHAGALLGVLAVFARQPHSFSHAHERMLILFANQAAVALENARIFAALKVRIDELEALNRVSKALGSVTTLEEILPQFLDQTLATSGAHIGALWLTDPNTKELPLAAYRGERDAFNEDWGQGEQISSAVFHLGQTLVSEPTPRDGSLFPNGWQGVCIPLHSGDEKLGVMLVAAQTPHTQSAEWVQLISILAEMVGNTIHRLQLLHSLAEMYFQVDRAKREWEQSVDAIEEAISLVDADGRILRVNQTLANWLNTPAPQLLGQACCRVLDNCTQPPAHCPHAQLMAARDKIYRSEIQSEHLGKTLHFTSYPLFDAEHQFVGAVNVLKDISVERDLQAQLIQSEKMAATGRLAASIAHEINNPLQGIQGCLELAHNFRGDGDKQERYLSLAKGEVDHLVATVQRMLDFYRPAKGTRTFQELEGLLQDVLALSANRVQSAKVRVEFEPGSNLPTVQVVGNQIKQVFLNLILNAVESMPEGGTLRIQARRQEDGVAIQFHDTGTGIAPEHIDKIFEPFFTTKPSGTGLGLGVSHNIVAHHGGRLTVASALGRGSTFTVWLPENAPTRSQV